MALPQEGGYEPFSSRRTKGLATGFPAFWCVRACMRVPSCTRTVPLQCLLAAPACTRACVPCVLCARGRLALVEELHACELLVSPTTGATDDYALEKAKDLAVALSL